MTVRNTSRDLGDRARAAGRDADSSTWMEWAARAGLVAYALIYLVVGWLAIQLAFGDHQGSPSSKGALRELAQQPVGSVLVWVVTIGMFLLVLWKGIDALVGHREEQDASKRTRKRLSSGLKAVLYAAVGVSGISVATHSSGGSSQQTWTAKVMDWPGGQVLVGAAGLAIIGYGAYQIWMAWSEKFTKKLDAEGRSGDTGRAFLAFGKAGYTAKGAAIVLVGGLFCYGALTHNAKNTGGLDEALLVVLKQPFGPVLLCVTGIGLACYGLFTFARARHLSE